MAVTYYDFRFNDVGAGDGLETAHWIRRSADGGASFGPDEMLGTTFDTRKAPYALGYFLGDYDGLGTVGNAFKPFWTSTQGSIAGKPVLDGGVDPRTAPTCSRRPCHSRREKRRSDQARAHHRVGLEQLHQRRGDLLSAAQTVRVLTNTLVPSLVRRLRVASAKQVQRTKSPNVCRG